MAILGIDLGAETTKVATVGRGGVQIVRNDLAERLTPTMVSYTSSERLVGDSALTSIKSNASRTVFGFKNLLGASQRPEWEGVVSVESRFSLTPLAPHPTLAGHIGYDVGEPAGVVSPMEVLIPFLKKIVSMSETYIQGKVTDCVVAVPSWFPEASRMCVVGACKLAGLGCHAVMNHNLATALDYGLFRNHTFAKDQSFVVVFCDIGYSAATVTAVEYTSGRLTVLACEESNILGGRVIDAHLAQKIAEDFVRKTGCSDPMKNTKARLKLKEAAEKAKKVLSANKQAWVNLECFFEEEDLNYTLEREVFEGMIQDYVQGITELCHRVQRQLNEAAPNAVVSSLEICGGGTRIPVVQQALQAAFNLGVSRTLSADECVARGAALQAAMLDPRHRVTPFTIQDRRFTPISLSVDSSELLARLFPGKKASEASGRQLTLIPAGQLGGYIECLELPVFAELQSFDFLLSTTMRLADPSIDIPIGRYTIKLGNTAMDAVKKDPSKCRLKTRFYFDVDMNIQCDAHFFYDIIEKTEEVIRTPKKDENGEVIPDQFDEVRVPKEAVIQKRASCTISVERPDFMLNAQHLEALKANEEKLTAQDTATQTARHVRNEVLSKVLKLRGALAGDSPQWSPFIEEAEKPKILATCDEVEEFVEMNDGLPAATYLEYDAKLNAAWAPCQARYDAYMEEQRKKAEAEAAARKAEEERIRQEQEAATAAARAAEEAAAQADQGADTTPAADVESKPASANNDTTQNTAPSA